MRRASRSRWDLFSPSAEAALGVDDLAGHPPGLADQPGHQSGGIGRLSPSSGGKRRPRLIGQLRRGVPDVDWPGLTILTVMCRSRTRPPVVVVLCGQGLPQQHRGASVDAQAASNSAFTCSRSCSGCGRGRRRGCRRDRRPRRRPPLPPPAFDPSQIRLEVGEPRGRHRARPQRQRALRRRSPRSGGSCASNELVCFPRVGDNGSAGCRSSGWWGRAGLCCAPYAWLCRARTEIDVLAGPEGHRHLRAASPSGYRVAQPIGAPPGDTPCGAFA